MEITLNSIIQKLKLSDNNWLKVNDESCLHGYFDEYYILLCQWYDANEGRRLIYIEVDDVEQMIDNVLLERYFEYSNEYNLLMPIYQNAFEKAVPAIRHSAS